ncbi:hypothetical protein FA15DRAFT_645855 [Coprinopsis marcescibilis]|uniref:Uncharacterized protein n=1 Tax=Coprinopsis marcescibilis TaxID=230819 RepID=A0A5C3KLQ7_COPMA|nr:hypothetical protein FA15DRAFT_645855 [Coprinopsis marcescibilis]
MGAGLSKWLEDRSSLSKRKAEDAVDLCGDQDFHRKKARLEDDNGGSSSISHSVQASNALDGTATSQMFQNANNFQIEGSQFIECQSYTNIASPEERIGSTFVNAQQYIKVTGDLKMTREAKIAIVLEWLTDINFRAIQADTLRKRAAKTGTWIFDHADFVEWIAGHRGILWGTGIPGAGKTILAAIVIDYLTDLVKSNKRACVVFAYCRYTEPLPVEKILAGLLRQILEDYDSTWPFIEPIYDHHKPRQTRPSQSELLHVLTTIFNSGLFDQRFCSLDGLDEATFDTQIDVLDALSQLPVNFLITSRPLPLLKDRIVARFIDIHVQDMDIERLIEEKIGRMVTLRKLLEQDGWKEKVVKAVLSKSAGMFLVASLQLDMLCSCLRIKDLREALDQLPTGVEAMYRTTLERIEHHDRRNVVRRALLWIIYARRPLSMKELLRAVSTCPDTYAFDDELSVDEDTLVSACCGLIVVESKKGEVRLVHYTAQDFLKRYLSQFDVDPHAVIASTCVGCLSQHKFDNYSGQINGYQGMPFQTQPLLRYSHENWASHTRSSNILPLPVIHFIRRCRRYPLRLDHRDSWWDYLSAYHLASAYGLTTLLSHWLGLDDTHPDLWPPPPKLAINAKTTKGRTPVAVATHLYNFKTLKILLRAEGVDVTSPDYEGQTPLLLAAQQDYVEFVQMLLEKVDIVHVNMSRQDSWSTVEGHVGDTALMVAAWNGSVGVVKALLRVEGVDVNRSHTIDGTALMQVSRKGVMRIVQMLLQHKDIDVNAKTADGQTAYTLAYERGFKGIADAIQNYGVQKDN